MSIFQYDTPGAPIPTSMKLSGNGTPVVLRYTDDNDVDRYADGGLVKAAQKVRRAGRYGDSETIHINKEELAELTEMWGPPSINPETGMPEFFLKKVWKAVKKIAPIASLFIPVIGPAVGAALGIGGIAGSALAGGVLGGISGGKKGALAGALTGGIAGGAGGVVGSKLANVAGIGGLGARATNAIGSGVLGAGAAAATGGNPLAGALGAGIGGYLSGPPQMGAQATTLPSVGTDVVAAANQPIYDVAGGADRLVAGRGSLPDFLPGPTRTTTITPPKSGGSKIPTLAVAGIGGLLLDGLFGKKKSSSAAPALIEPPPSSGGLGMKDRINFKPVRRTYTPYEGDVFSYGQSGGEQRYFSDPIYDFSKPPSTMAEGGDVEEDYDDNDMMAHLVAYSQRGGHEGPGHVRGIGSGQEDKIPAWLSDGEYVWSAQDVADLGDGSTDEGVRRLDKMRHMVRAQAGRRDVKKIAKPQRGIEQMLMAVGGAV